MNGNALQYKDQGVIDSMKKLDPRFLPLIADMADWCEQNGLNFRITRAVAPMIPGVSKTDIHADGRAIDVAVRGWAQAQISSFIEYFNSKYSQKIGAFPMSGGAPIFVVYHDGTAYHFHIQIRKP